MGNIGSRTSNWNADEGVKVRVLREDGEYVGYSSRITADGVYVKVVASGSDGCRSLTAVDGERVDVQVVDSKDDATCAWDSILNQSICSDDGSTGSRGEPVKIILCKPLSELKRLEEPKGELEVERMALESSRKIFQNKVAQLNERCDKRIEKMKSKIAQSRRFEVELNVSVSSKHVDRGNTDVPVSDVHNNQPDVNAEVQELKDEMSLVMQKIEQVSVLHMRSRLVRKVFKSDRDKGQGLVRGEGLITKDRRTKWKERSLHEPSKSRSEDNRNPCDGVKLKECTWGRKAKDKRERGGHVAGRRNLTGSQQEQRWRNLRCSA